MRSPGGVWPWSSILKEEWLKKDEKRFMGRPRHVKSLGSSMWFYDRASEICKLGMEKKKKKDFELGLNGLAFIHFSIKQFGCFYIP